jgi:hypothetical protein
MRTHRLLHPKRRSLLPLLSRTLTRWSRRLELELDLPMLTVAPTPAQVMPRVKSSLRRDLERLDVTRQMTKVVATTNGERVKWTTDAMMRTTQ